MPSSSAVLRSFLVASFRRSKYPSVAALWYRDISQMNRKQISHFPSFFSPPGLPADAQTTDTTAHQSKQCDLWASTAQSHKTKAKSSSVLSAAHITSNTATARDHCRSQQSCMCSSEACSALFIFIEENIRIRNIHTSFTYCCHGQKELNGYVSLSCV